MFWNVWGPKWFPPPPPRRQCKSSLPGGNMNEILFQWFIWFLWKQLEKDQQINVLKWLYIVYILYYTYIVYINDIIYIKDHILNILYIAKSRVTLPREPTLQQKSQPHPWGSGKARPERARDTPLEPPNPRLLRRPSCGLWWSGTRAKHRAICTRSHRTHRHIYNLICYI